MAEQLENIPEQSTSVEQETMPEAAVKTSFSQEQVNQLIGKARQEERSKLERDQKLKGTQDLEEAKQISQDLTSQLDNANEHISKLEGIVEGLISKQMKALPKPTRKLLEKLSLVDQLAWLEDNADELKDLSGQDEKSIPELPESRSPNLEKAIAGDYKQPRIGI